MTSRVPTAWHCVLLSVALSTVNAGAADTLSSTLWVKDGLAVPNRPVTIEAKLATKSLLTSAGLGGEPLELVVDGQVVSSAMTGGDGKALLAYTPKAQGIVRLQVRVGHSPRVAPAEGLANLAVWERRNPIIAVELASLMEELPPGAGLTFGIEPKPMPDAANELGKLTQFYYRVVYVVSSGSGASDAFQTTVQARDWLKTHKFPAGYVLVLPSGDQALGEKIDELHAAGWKTIKTGIGRSKAFVEAFLQRRLEAVMVPIPAKADTPRKAKLAKDWKEVRKKL